MGNLTSLIAQMMDTFAERMVLASIESMKASEPSPSESSRFLHPKIIAEAS